MATKRSNNQYTLDDLLGLAVKELEESVTKPNILSYTPYPEQERFHKCDLFGRYVSGGNRGGKTDSVVVEAIWWATNTHPFLKRPESWGTGALELRFVVVDVSKGVEQIILPKLKRWCATSMLIDGSFEKSWDSNNMIFTFSNGSTIDFLTHGMGLEKFGGVPRHIVFFDEEPPQHIFNETLMRLIDYDGKWVIAATPVTGMTWTFDLLWEPAEAAIAAGEEHDTGIFTLSAAQNPYLKAENLDKFMIGMNREEREVRESGKFVARSGLVFPSFPMNLHKFVHEPIMPPRSWKIYSSVDFGLNNPTAWLWHAVGPGGDIITFAEHYKNEMLVNEHSQIVKAREASWGLVPSHRVGDPAGSQRSGITGTSTLQEYALRGIYIQTDGIPHEVAIGIEKMQQYFRFTTDSYWSVDGEPMPKWVISSNCTNLIRELKKLRWKTYASEKLAYDHNKTEEVHKKDDHAFDSARYFATLMPDLTPADVEPTMAHVPTTISYQDLMAKMSMDPEVQFTEESPALVSDWQTEFYEEPSYDY